MRQEYVEKQAELYISLMEFFVCRLHAQSQETSLQSGGRCIVNLIRFTNFFGGVGVSAALILRLRARAAAFVARLISTAVGLRFTVGGAAMLYPLRRRAALSSVVDTTAASASQR
jgi:hypothetical protein